jgi:hypothetical protein
MLLLRRENVAGIRFGDGPMWMTVSTPAASVLSIASQSLCGRSVQWTRVSRQLWPS